MFSIGIAMANILVVDDHVDTCKVLVRLLRHLHHAASCVHSGEEALAHLAQSPLPDLIILDVMMPGMDGIEVLRRIRSQPATANVLVVMFSAVTDPNFREHAISKGATDYWPKAGLDFDDLTRRLAGLLRPSDNASAIA